MSIAATYNYKLDGQQIYVFSLQFTDDGGSPIDVTSWSFNFTLTYQDGTVEWDIANIDFARPSPSEIYFEKSVADVGALPNGLFSISLKVTNTVSTNDEIMNGTYQK